MKTAIAILGLLLSSSLLAVEAPKIAVGDYLLMYAQIIDCGAQPMAIEAAYVKEGGTITLFGDVSLLAEGKPVHQVRDELVDEMERRTGHRSKTLEFVHVSGTDKEAVARRLLRFSAEVEQRCARRTMPPMDLDEDWLKLFERLVHSEHGSLFDSAAASGLESYFREVS
jgi:hypothetical protein